MGPVEAVAWVYVACKVWKTSDHLFWRFDSSPISLFIPLFLMLALLNLPQLCQQDVFLRSKCPLRQWRGNCLALANASSYFCGFAGVTLLMLATPGLEYHTSRVDPTIGVEHIECSCVFLSQFNVLFFAVTTGWHWMYQSELILVSLISYLLQNMDVSSTKTSIQIQSHETHEIPH